MLTHDQITFFHENGYLHLKSVLGEEELRRLRAAADRLAEDGQRRAADPEYVAQLRRLRPDWIDHPDTRYVYEDDGHGGVRFHRVEWMWTKDAIFRHTSMHPVVLEAVSQLLDGRPFWPRGGSLVYKLPGHGAAVPWHQDIPYYWRRTVNDVPRPRAQTYPTPNFTTDFYLEASRGDQGGVWCIPGSHRQGSVDVDAMVAEHGFRLPGAIPLEAEPGDVLFHHVALIHGSDVNTSSHLRRTFYQAYLSGDVLQDAYSDWPELKSDDENVAFWEAAKTERRAENLPSEGRATISPHGIVVE
jgi:ectoine hydroxylase-related dioxygenase (phytanoyl-CoA dioxygenase family)